MLKCFTHDDRLPIIDVKRKVEEGGTITIMPMFSNIGTIAGVPVSRLSYVPKYLTKLIR